MSHQRAVVRYPSSSEPLPSLNPSNSGFIFRAEIRQPTAQGVGLLLRKQLVAGMEVSIDLPDAAGNYTTTMLATVTRVAPAEGRWLAECAFARPLTDSELRGLS